MGGMQAERLVTVIPGPGPSGPGCVGSFSGKAERPRWGHKSLMAGQNLHWEHTLPGSSLRS